MHLTTCLCHWMESMSICRESTGGHHRCRCEDKSRAHLLVFLRCEEVIKYQRGCSFVHFTLNLEKKLQLIWSTNGIVRVQIQVRVDDWIQRAIISHILVCIDPRVLNILLKIKQNISCLAQSCSQNIKGLLRSIFWARDYCLESWNILPSSLILICRPANITIHRKTLKKPQKFGFIRGHPWPRVWSLCIVVFADLQMRIVHQHLE